MNQILTNRGVHEHCSWTANEEGKNENVDKELIIKLNIAPHSKY